MIEIVFPLPWPHPDLSPNARVHFQRKARRVKAARRDAFYAVMKAAQGRRAETGGHVELELVFIPPNKRRFDDDGMVARMKSARDGIADYLKIDDYYFKFTHRVSTVPTPGGEVLIKVRLFPAPEIPEQSTA